MFQRIKWALVFASIAACGGVSSEQVHGNGPTFFQDVEPILSGRCVSCHHDGGIAPFSLASYEEAAPLANSISEAVSDRTMPPWFAVSGARTYLDDPTLSDTQVATLVAWAQGGAPAGDASRPGTPLPVLGEGLSRIDLTLGMPLTYTQVIEPDEYRCFVVDWPIEERAYVTGFQANPGNREVVHHLAVFLMPPEPTLLEILADWDAQDPGPGYPCFGGPSATGSDGAPIQQLAQWVPGSEGHDFPPGTGILVEPGSRLVLQMHYNSGASGPGPDRSSLAFKVDPSVERRAAYVPFLDARWATGALEIPPAQQEVVQTVTGDPRGFFRLFSGDLDLSAGFDVHSALLHQHKLGTGGDITLDRSDGSRQILLKQTRYDFDWQREYRFVESVRFEGGDVLTVTCRWSNPGDTLVSWGEGSAEEMCVGNLFISELGP